MRFHKYVFCLVLCFAVIAVTAEAQKGTTIPVPVITQLPAAMGRYDNQEKIDFKISRDGQYALANSGKEAKAWKLPEGTLVFRAQVDRLPQGTGSSYYQRFSQLVITDDGKYIYVSGPNQLSELALQAYELPSGATVPPGKLLDSLRSGAYQRRHNAGTLDYLPEATKATLRQAGTSPLWRKRDIDNGGRDEPIELLSATPDPAHPGEMLIFYTQQYCGSKDWIKGTLGKSVKELRKLQAERNHCQYDDYHVARYNPASGRVAYIGNFIPGVGNADFGTQLQLFPSPSGDAVMVLWSDAYVVYDLTGKIRWRADRSGNRLDFDGYDDAGNLVFAYRYPREQTAFYIRDGLTGDTLRQYIMPRDMYKSMLIERWGMYADILYGPDNTYFTISLHDMKDGRMMVSLTDDEAAKTFARNYKAAADAIVAAEKERIRKNTEAWERGLRESAAAEAARQARLAQQGAEHAKHFMRCPKCDGIGYFSKSGYSRGTTSTSTGTFQNTITGEKSTVTTTTTKGEGAYSIYEVCPRCRGSREVPR